MSETPALNIRITADESSALHALDGLVSALERIKAVVSNGFSGVTQQIEKLQNTFAAAIPDKSVASYERMAAALERIAKAGTPMSQPSSGGLPGATGAGTGAGAGSGAPVPPLVPQDSGVTETTRQIKEMTDTINSAGSSARGQVNSFKRLTDALRNTGDESNRTDGFLKKLLKTIGRIALTRAIRYMIKAITQGIKTGIDNVRKYSEHIGSAFDKAMDSVNNATLKMKNSIGAALAPAIQALIPYVIQLVNWFIQLLNTVNQFISLMTGAATWTRAIDVDASSLEDTEKKAKKAGKAIKNLLADWDELNIIQSESNSGGGGGSSKDDEKYVNMFEQVGVFDEKIRSLVGWLKENMETILAVAKLIGAALLGWKLHTMFTSALGRVVITILGLLAAVYGTMRAYEALKDQFDNGINWDNFKQLVEGAAIAVLGLTAAFGMRGLGFGLAGFGLIGVASALYDIWKNGEASKEALDQLKISLLAGGIGVSILTGSWVWGLAGVVAAAAITIYQNKEKIVKYIQDHVLEISNILQNAGDASIAVGALLAFSGVSIVGGIGMIAAGLAMKDIGTRLPDAVSGDVEQTLKNISTIVGKDLLAIGALLVISGIGIKAGLFMLLGGAIALGYGSGEGEDFKSYLTSAWTKVKNYVQPISLGLFAVGAVLALTGVGIGVGLRMMALGLPGIGIGIASGTLLNDMKAEWLKISSWAFPLSLGLFTTGLLLALTGAGLKAGLVMMGLGAAGIAAEASFGDLLGSLKDVWAKIDDWALPLAAGSFVLGMVLALSGAGLAVGLAMMAGGVALIGADVGLGEGGLMATLQRTWNSISEWALPLGGAAFVIGAILAFSGANIPMGLGLIATGIGAVAGAVAFDDLTGTLMQKWNEISAWAFPLAVGSFVLGAILALTGAGTGVGLAMMAAGVVGVTAEALSGDLLGPLIKTWNDISGWAFPLSVGSFVLGMVLAMSGAGVGIGLAMMAAGAGGIAAQAVTGDLLASLMDMWNEISSWALPLAVGSFVLGAILAFTGAGIGIGLAMMAAGATGIAGEVAFGSLLSDLQATWNEIAHWAIPASLGLFVLGTLFALSGAAVGIGLAMMVAGGAGLATGFVTYENLAASIKEKWSEISGWVTIASLGALALGAVLAFTGVGIPIGLALICAGIAGLVGSVTFGDLLGGLQQVWNEIANWAFPLSLGLFALGAVLAFTGVAIPIGLGLMIAGGAGVAAGIVQQGDLNSEMAEKWNEMSRWILPLSAGSFVLGAILAFTGIGIPVGIAMMAAGAAGVVATAESSGLLANLQEVWAGIQQWSDLIAVGSMALGLILVLTGIGIPAGIAMIAAGMAVSGGSIDWNAFIDQLRYVFGGIAVWWENTVQPKVDAVVEWVDKNVVKKIVTFFSSLKARINTKLTGIKTVFEAVWKQYIYPVVEWIDDNIVQPIVGFFTALWGTIQGDENNNIITWWEDLWYTHFGGVVDWIKTNITDKISGFFEGLGKTIRRVFGWIFGTEDKYEEVFKEYESFADAYKGYHEVYGEDSVDKPIAMSIAYVIDHNNGQALELGSELAKDVTTGLVKEFSLDTENVLAMLSDAFGWDYQDIVNMIDFSKLTEEEYADVTEILETLDLEFPAPDTKSFTDGMDSAAQSVETDAGRIIAAFKSLDGLSFGFSGMSGGIGGMINVSFPTMAAAGGMFTAGEMFVAREAGPEMIGRIGNRTTVANNDQIVSGIAGGVAAGQEEQNALLRRQNDILMQMLNKKFTAEAVPSSEWGRFNKQSNAMYERNTGVR